MEALLRKRMVYQADLAKAVVDFCPTNVDAGTPQIPARSLEEMEIHLEELDRKRTVFLTVQESIEAKIKAEDLQDALVEHSQLEGCFIRVKAAMRKLISELTPEPTSSPNLNAPIASSENISSLVQLPKIVIPTFSGTYTEWPSFCDLFSSMVHNKSHLSGVQKLQYLKGALTGEPLRLIQVYQVTEANYIEAWNRLNERYFNPRVIILAHVKSLFQAQALTVESAHGLRKLLDTFQENLSALKVLEQPTSAWSTLLLHVLSEKLDQETRKQWELSLKGTALPAFSELCVFLENRSRALEVATSSTKQRPPQVAQGLNSKQAPIFKSSRHGSHSFVTSEPTCGICEGLHSIYKCQTFMESQPQERSTLAKSHRLCFNCLGTKHAAEACKSSHSCKVCKKKHHTLLHFEPRREPATPAPSTSVPAQNLFAKDSEFQVMLSTVVISVQDEYGHHHPCRALLDSGSQANFVTSRFASKLKLHRRKYTASILGLSSSTKAKPQGIVTFIAHSMHSPFQVTMNAVVLHNIADAIPSTIIDPSKWIHINGLPLADPEFNKPGSIDALLGAEVFAQVLSGQRLQSQHGPAAFKTEFGWILSGNCNVPSVGQPSITSCLAVTQNLDHQLKRFWEIEETPQKPFVTKEEAECETHFLSSHSRDPSGRYVTELPFKVDPQCLGESRTRAVQQFTALERRMSTNPELSQEYTTFMREYEQLQHMEPVTNDSSTQAYYIPHHAVTKRESTTTKLRVVFNASATTTTGTSLNDCLMVGPTMQPTLVELIIRFRFHKIALVADIEKMYRQVQLAHHHRDFQRIVWRESPEQPIRDYRLTTVTYGTSSAPFVAVRALKQLAEDEGHRYPVGAVTLKNDFYVDDLISGADSESEAIALKTQLTKLLSLGGFNLRKWTSNLANPTTSTQPLEFDQPTSTKALGISWRPQRDEFFFNCKPLAASRLTKRTLLAEISKLFDPLGWLSPVVLIGKMLIQRLWVVRTGWDDEVPLEVLNTWTDLCNQWPVLNQVQIPRFHNTSKSSILELHGFSDACEQAYGAVVYLRAIQPSGTICVSLLMSKTKVAPLKQISIPKLELCGAVLLCRLLKFISATLSSKDLQVFAWTDSTIVLNWLSDIPRRWKTFIANRVAEIQESFPIHHWRHVSTATNPADCCSRGSLPTDLVENSLWWNGPAWLLEQELPHHNLPPVCHLAEEEARGPIVLLAAESVNVLHRLINKFSSLHRLIRVVAFCLRFLHNCRSQTPKLTNRIVSPINLQEFADSRHRIITVVQSMAFPAERSALISGNTIAPTSHLKSLHPFIDHVGILRVGGRLANSNLPFEQKHPIILPHDNHFTLLVVQEEHRRLLHAGPTLLMTSLRSQFWILRIRSLVKQVVFHCTICFKLKARTTAQLMGSLPSVRVEPARPFIRCGVDCAGPFLIRDRVRAGRPQLVKSYVVLFVCFSTKAIHLELASDLSSSCFIAAFNRFTARRGLPHDVFSDCGTNFVGAQGELNFSSPEFQDCIQAYAVPKSIQWHFNPPAAPHMGGLWEAGIKSTKFHLHRVIGTTPLTFEELYTVLTQVEACLNSRPLCPSSTNWDDVEPLTPAHFLIGEALTTVPCRDYSEVPDNRLKTRWNLIKKLSQTFWNRWSTEYLSRLQQRPKWMHPLPNFEPGDLVLVKNEQSSPLQWNLARVVTVHPGKDSLVRVVSLRAHNKTFKRPVTKICKLPLD